MYFNVAQCARKVEKEHFLADRNRDHLTTKCDHRNGQLAKEERQERTDVFKKGEKGGCA